jgi:hypothetical protein
MFTLQTKTQHRPVDKLAALDKAIVLKALLDFIDVATTATARGTFYNTKAEQKAALESIHNSLFVSERSLYAAALMLPGMNDYSKQLGVARLLLNKRVGEHILTDVQERVIIEKMIADLPVHRMLNLYGMLREQRINNARTRKIILRSLLNARNLPLWSVRYRRKLGVALEHAWGKRMTGILRSILSKSERNAQEAKILNSNITKYLTKKSKANQVFECIGFVLGNREGLTVPILKAFVDAKTDIFKGKKLPYEVLEGIRGRYFKDELTSADILELTKANLTSTQKMTLQNKTKESAVEVAFDPMKQNAVKLYIYAYNQGMSHDVRTALNKKAKEAAEKLPLSFNHIGILMDGSESMRGNIKQPLRPIATACATRDVLMAASELSTIHYAGGVADDNGLVQVEGDTTLASGLIELLEKGVEAIFIITDGYENAPAGRVGEVIQLARQIGIEMPIFQVSPVMAAEAGGLRRLNESVMTLPVSQPTALSVGLLKAQLEIDIQKGVLALLQMTVPKLG